MKTKFTLLALTLSALTALTSLAVANNEKTSVNASDAKIIKETAADGQSEVQLAELAVRKAQGAQVKALAEKLVADHVKMDKDLQALAKTKNVDTTKAEDSQSASTANKLDMQNGQEFDKTFLNDLEKAHKQAVENFESNIKKAEDPQLKALLENQLPTIKEHLNKIEQLKEGK